MANAFDQFDSTSEDSNPFDQFDSTGQEHKSMPNENPITLDSALQTGVDLSNAAADTAKGMVEGPVATAGGILSFMGSVPPAIGKFAASGVEEIANDPLVLLDSQKRNAALSRMGAAAYDTMSTAGEGISKVIEPALPNTSRFGQTITTVAGSMFGAPHEAIDIGAKALYGEGWEEKAKAGKFAFDILAVGVPHVLKKVKEGKMLSAEDIAEADAKLNEFKIDPKSPVASVKAEDVFDLLRNDSAVSDIPAPVNPVNADIITKLTEEMKGKEGRSKYQYKKVIKAVAESTVDMKDVDLITWEHTGKDVKKGPNKIIAEVISRRVGKDVPLDTPIPEVRSPEDIPIAESGNAPLNNETKQPPVQGWLPDAVAEDVSKGVVIKTPEGVEGWIHNPEIIPFDKSRVESRKRVRKAGGPTTVELPQYPDIESVKGDWELGSEISRAKALEEVQFDIGGDGESGYELVKKAKDSPYSAVQVGDKYYRVVKKPEVPMQAFQPTPEVLPEGYADTFLDNLKDEEFTGQGGIGEVSSEPIFEGTRGPDKVVKAKKKAGVLTAEDLKAWREGHIAEINAKKMDASLNKSTQESTPPITSQDLPIISDRFKTYESPEAAKADGVKGKLLQDPETGRWMEEPRFEDDIPELFGDAEMDSPYYPEKSRGSIEDFDGELEYDGGKNLWDLMNNERGSITFELPNIEKLELARKEYFKKARELAKNLKLIKIKGSTTGWEINDANAKLLTDLTSTNFATLEKLLDHPTLFEVLPHLKTTPVKITTADSIIKLADMLNKKVPNRDVTVKHILGAYIDGTIYLNTENFSNSKFTPLQILIHEVQHAITGDSESLANTSHKRLFLSYDERVKNPLEVYTNTQILKPSKILGNQRGAIEIDPVAVKDGLKRFYKMAKDAADRGMTFPDYLTFRGISEEGKRKLLKFQQDIPEYEKIVRESNPVNYDILKPPVEEIVHRRVIHNKDGEVVSQGVPVTKGDIQRVLNAGQGKIVGGKVAGIFTIPTYRWEDFSGSLKKRFFRNWEYNVRKLDEGIVEGRVTTAEIVKEFSSKKEREDFFYAWTAQQKMGKEHLASMGVTKIPEWNAKFEGIKQKMQERFDRDLKDVNEVRVNTGRHAIKRRDNYFPLIHAMNKLHEMGIKENLSTMSLERISVLEKKYNGPSTWFDKPRKLKTGVPIELDPFEAFDKYHAAILQEVYMGPIAALAKELANYKYPVEGKSRPVGLDRLNPNLQEFLRSWSDDILGKDPMWEAVLKSRVGPLGKWFDKRVQNIAPARLGYKLTTGLVQFSGLVPVGVTAGPLNLAWGITEALTRRGIGRLEKLAGIKTGVDTNKAWRLSTTLHNRLNKGDELLANLVDNLSSDNAIKHWQKNASILMNYTDALTSEMAFYSFLLDGRRHKMSMADAIEYADDMVGKTQGLGIKGALSPVQASKISSWAFKMQTFLIANANVINREVLGVNNPNVGMKKGLTRGIRILVGMQIANEAFKAVGLNSPFPDPIEAYEESKKKGADDVSTAANMLKEYLELVPGGGGSIKYNSSLFGIVGGVANDFPKDLNQGIKLAFDWENMSRTERINAGLAVGDMLGTYYGVPGTSQLKGMIRNAVKGEDWYTVVLGAYQREADKKGGKLGKLQGLKGLDK